MNRILLRRLANGATFPLLLLAGMVLAVFLTRPAAPLPASTGTEAFSAERAFQHVETIAATPRPIGSSAHADVRSYLVERFTDFGLEVEVQDTVASYLRTRHPGRARFARVQNVIATLPGDDPERDKALLLMAHYDSRPLTPGAGDDASGTATLLETARALASQGPFRNDVIFLVTDGEESGLFGAQAFFRQHALAARVGTVLNIEARGSAGPVLMFQSSPGNAELIDILASASDFPAGNSLADAIYRRMRNDTDFSIPLEHGLQGLNFAYIDGFFDYHSPTDTPENLSLRSLQHAGDQVLPVARELANRELPVEAGSDRVFFNLLGSGGFVSYPQVMDWIVFAAGLLLVGFAALPAVREGRLGAIGMLRATVSGIFLVVLPALAVNAAFALFVDVTAEDGIRSLIASMDEWLATWLLLAVGTFVWLAGRLVAGITRLEAAAISIIALLGLEAAGLPLLVAVVVAAAIGGLLVTWLCGETTPLELRTGGLLLWLLGGITMLLLEPAGAYLFTWPLLLAAVVVMVGHLTQQEPSSIYRVSVALPVILCFGFLVYFVNLALGFATPMVTAALVLLLAMWVSTIFPDWLETSRHWSMVLVVAALGMAPWLAATSAFDARTPRPNQLFVVHDQVDGRSYIASSDQFLGDWQKGILGNDPPMEIPAYWHHSDDQAFMKEIPHESGPALTLEIVEDRLEGNDRILKLRLAATPGIARGLLVLQGAAGVNHANVDGEMIARPSLDEGDDWRWYWVGMPEDGYEIEVQVEDGRLPEIQSVAFVDGMPPGLELPPRPAEEMAEPYSWSDSTVIIQQLVTWKEEP